MKIISIDVETNGLWGQPFAVAFVVYDKTTGTIDHKVFRCPIEEHLNPWVEQNVLPVIKGIDMTHTSYESMLQDIGKYYLSVKDNATVLWHMGHVVEAYLFRELHRVGAIGDWDAPYTPIELSVLLERAGYAPDSVDNYIKQNNIKVDEVVGGTHNPLYDAIAALKVYLHLI